MTVLYIGAQNPPIAALTAHTVVTTYTIKVAGYAMICDVELLSFYDTITDLIRDIRMVDD